MSSTRSGARIVAAAAHLGRRCDESEETFMRLVTAFLLILGLGFASAGAASAGSTLEEHVTGGALDLTWVGGFNTPNTMYAKTLDGSDPAFTNPSGDHTVAVAQNAAPDSGGLIVTVTDPGAIGPDYVWEGWFFTGEGNTRRGLVLRADPSNNFQSFYMFVIDAGLFQIRFRKIVNNGTPVTLGTWFATSLPAGSIAQNTWHKMRVVAIGSEFRCYFDDYQLTATPIVDSDLPSGWVGCYNFRFDLGNVPVYFDDLVLSGDFVTPAHATTWGELKRRYR
jgi:hypothetical protein